MRPAKVHKVPLVQLACRALRAPLARGLLVLKDYKVQLVFRV